MKAHALILIRDKSVLSTFTEVFASADFEITAVTTIGDVLSRLTERLIHTVVIDLDCASEGPAVLHAVRKCQQLKTMTLFALVSDRAEVKGAYETGADFVFPKPVSALRIAASLKITDELHAGISLALPTVRLATS
jgi:DNA-binding response OmpR family regulator